MSKPQIVVMAHRGGQGLWPPNTLYAFEQAVALGVDALELDIHSTRDGFLVVCHDPTVDATTNGHGAIKDFSLEELKRLDAGYPWTADEGQSYPYRGQGITIPTLEEALGAFDHIPINIDIKPQEPEVVDKFCRVLRDLNKMEQVVVGSFHDRQLRRFRKLCPQVTTAAGVGETRSFYFLNRLRLDFLYRPKAFAFQIPESEGNTRLITPRFIQGAHARGMKVHVWTVNEIADMKRLIAWGVDGLISDYPDRLLALLEEYE